MELRQLRYFMALADTLHFGLAAERLNIVQPALSMQIKKLEEELGAALFVRSKRKVVLTHSGELFREEARRCLAHAEQARAIARAAQQGTVGQLRLGVSSGAVQSGVLRSVLRSFRSSSPQLLVEPEEIHPARAPDAVLRADLDAALVTVASLVLPRGLETRRMIAHAAMVVIPEDHPLAEQPDIAPEALRHETFVGFAGPDDPSGLSLTAGALGYVPASHRAVSNPSMTVGFVAAGLGVAIIPDVMARPEPGAVFRRLRGTRFEVDITLLWASDGNPGAKASIARMLADTADGQRDSSS